jgi:hypothetical protein
MCHSSRHHHQPVRERPVRERPAAQPVDPNMRVSQAERDAVITELQHDVGDGRLTLDEFEVRVEQALASVTRADLDVVRHDMPRAVPAPVRARSHGYARGPMVPTPALVIAAVVALAIVAGAPWLLWSLFWLIPATRRHSPAH